jgi:hypothetical protein
MEISTNRRNLEWDLHEWMADVVRQTKQPPESGSRPETILLATAQDSIDVLMQAAPTSMALGGPSRKQTVHAQFVWGRFPDGSWYVRAVSFGVDVGAAQLQLARQRVIKQRALDKAETQNAQHMHLRQFVFPVESHVETWTQEIDHGKTIILSAIDRAHEHAKEDAKTLQNPVTPVDMALDMVGAGVKHLKGEIPGGKKLEKMAEELGHDQRWIYEAENLPQILAEERGAGARHLADLYEGIDYAIGGGKVVKAMREDEKSPGDKLLESGLELSGHIPGAGPFVKTIAGMMFDIAISSDASRVTKLRSRCYVYFVAGYIHKLALTDTGVPGRKLDKKYFDLGTAAAPPVSSPGSVPAQIALMYYASEHYTDGGWGGFSYRKEDWHFPEQYIVKWSPELLGRALATQLHTREYLLG